MLNCALIGNGYWGKIVSKYLNGNCFTLVDVCDITNPTSRTVDQVLNDEKIIAVFICTPVETHFQIAKSAIIKHKHVFCEKPLTHKIEEIKELYNLAEKEGVILITDYIYLYSNSLKEMINKLYLIGNIQSCTASIQQFGKFYKNENTFDIIGLHMISSIMNILSVHYNKLLWELKDITEIRVVNNELVSGVLEMKINNISVKIESDSYSIYKERRIEIIGTKGTIFFDMNNDYTLQIMENHNLEVPNYTYFKFDEYNNLRNVIEHFYETIINNKYDIINRLITENVTLVLEQIRNQLDVKSV